MSVKLLSTIHIPLVVFIPICLYQKLFPSRHRDSPTSVPHYSPEKFGACTKVFMCFILAEISSVVRTGKEWICFRPGKNPYLQGRNNITNPI